MALRRVAWALAKPRPGLSLPRSLGDEIRELLVAVVTQEQRLASVPDKDDSVMRNIALAHDALLRAEFRRRRAGSGVELIIISLSRRGAARFALAQIRGPRHDSNAAPARWRPPAAGRRRPRDRVQSPVPGRARPGAARRSSPRSAP